ncbi:hypothetical protein [Solicola gregarius]|uniref:Uncharacterized protein n=1 Tax=Solicola gregarius TaxID=2908642 RepID=A0AA46YPM6_9ACTN|nr:hypothetical protein [Solicola gregarius]UYM07768.1 hypothetical protein L0C25_12075 [Solicola gregarius]
MSDEPLAMYRHARAGFALPAPRTWVLHEDPQEQVAAAIVAPANGDDFRPNIVVTVDDLEPGHTLESWQEFTESVSPQLLDQYLLIDNELLEQRGHPVFHRLAHHANPDGVALTMEQWCTVRGNRGFTLTGTAGTMDLLDSAGLFAEVARGFRTDEDDEDAEETDR